MPQGNMHQRYNVLAQKREPYLKKARLCSALTKPSLIPPEGVTNIADLPIPSQPTGAEGVSNISAKLNQTLFPISTSWLKHQVPDDTRKETLVATEGEQILTEIEKKLSSRENKAMRYMETTNLRTANAEMFDHLAIAGNCLMCIPMAEEEMRCFGMDRYVIDRDSKGRMTEAIIKEEVTIAELPDEVRTECNVTDETQKNSPKIVLYTQVKPNKEKTRWIVKQELNDVVIPEKGIGDEHWGAWAHYPYDMCPYFAPRWFRSDGRIWSESYVNEYLGALTSLDILYRAITETTQIGARALIGIKPGASTKRKDVATARNGAVIAADFDNDVSMLRMDKGQDLSSALKLLEDLKLSLAKAFMMDTAAQRSGERVTAYEIQAMIQAINERMGNVYGLFASEVQLPEARLMLKRMEKLGKIEPLADDLVEVTIVTGLQALGRGADLQKLMQFADIATSMFGQDALPRFTHPEVGLTQIQTGLQLDSKGFIKTREEIEAEKQQELQMAQAQMLMDAAKPAINNLTKDSNGGVNE